MVRRSHGGRDGGPTDFSASLNPLGPPPGVVRALRDSVHGVTRYPYRLHERLRRRIARSHGLEEDRVLVTAGASGALTLLRGRFRGGRAQVAVPTYTEYEDTLGPELTVDTTPRWPCDGGETARVLEGFDPPSTDLMILCNPNNPTGGALAGERLMALADRARSDGAHLAVDEAYAGFTGESAGISLAGRVGESDNLWVVRSFTKLYGMPGLRVGYLLCPPGEASRLRGRRSPWPVGTPALRGALAALDADRFRSRTRRFMERERRRVGLRLEALDGVRRLPTAANYYLCRGPTDWQSRLDARGWTVRDASSFTGLTAGWIRFSLRAPDRTNGLLRAMAGVLAGSRAGGEARERP